MLRNFKSIFNSPESKTEKAGVIELSLAVCVLLLEIARADEKFTEDERLHIFQTIQQRYHLSEEETSELIDTATEIRDESIDLWQFTNRVNQSYSQDRRREIMEELWRVIYADGTLNKHEDYLVRQFSKLFKLRHSDMISAKLKVLNES
jgi:uncharacterized tellurite resistance protein B-like protein